MPIKQLGTWEGCGEERKKRERICNYGMKGIMVDFHVGMGKMEASREGQMKSVFILNKLVIPEFSPFWTKSWLFSVLDQLLRLF
jgi:hypothetical protein